MSVPNPDNLSLSTLQNPHGEKNQLPKVVVFYTHMVRNMLMSTKKRVGRQYSISKARMFYSCLLLKASALEKFFMIKKYINWVWWHTPLVPVLSGQWISEFEVSVVYMVSSKTARVTETLSQMGGGGKKQKKIFTYTKFYLTYYFLGHSRFPPLSSFMTL